MNLQRHFRTKIQIHLKAAFFFILFQNTIYFSYQQRNQHDTSNGIIKDIICCTSQSFLLVLILLIMHVYPERMPGLYFYFTSVITKNFKSQLLACILYLFLIPPFFFFLKKAPIYINI